MIFDLKNEYMEEIWKDVKGYEELYQVSNYGQIRSVDRTVGYRYKGKQRIYKGRMLKQVVRNGYLSVSLSKENKLIWFLIWNGALVPIIQIMVAVERNKQNLNRR